MTIPVTVETANLHPATASCLEALQRLQSGHDYKNILDIGCGDGILSLMCAALWNAPVLAADISPEAVEETTRQCAAHKLDHLITTIRSDGFNDPLIGARAPYDLILCNLLAEPIIGWAPLMQSHLAQGGICLLSGILAWRAPDVETTYPSFGFEMLHSIPNPPWMTYVFCKA